jgi:hypothetical protein
MGGALSIVGRFVKIEACLANSAVYQMLLRLFHKTTIEDFKKPIRAFLWSTNSDKRKYHLVKWKHICKPRSKGGLAIKDLTRFNISLMCKWWWKLEKDNGP